MLYYKGTKVKKVVKRLTASRQLDSNLKGENMRGRIDFDKFKQYALDLLKEGTKICPCCLSRSILFTTDENHNEFWLECRVCHVGVRNPMFMRTHLSWKHRPSNIEKINATTQDIECSYWDDEISRDRYVTMDDLPKEEVEDSQQEVN